MSTLSFDDLLRKKMLGLDTNQYDRYRNLGIEDPRVTPSENGGSVSWAAKYGFDEGSNPTIFDVARAVEGNEGGGAASTFAVRPGDNIQNNTTVVAQNQPSGELSVQPPNTSGTTVTSSALTGTEQNSRLNRQNSATDDAEKNPQNRPDTINRPGQNAIWESLSFTPDSQITKPPETTPASEPTATGEATLSAQNPNETAKPNGEGTITAESTEKPADNSEIKADSTDKTVEDNKPPETEAEINADAERKAAEEAQRKAQEEAQKRAMEEQAA